MLPWIVDAEPHTFEEEIRASVPVLVDFWAPWCGPCRMVSPLVERIGRDHAGHLKVVKLNVDDAPEISGRYGIQGIPLLVLIRAGSEADRLVGAVPERRLREWLEPHLKAPAGSAS
jgi:thioredoxin 2